MQTRRKHGAALLLAICMGWSVGPFAPPTFTVAKLEYGGGGDWYANPSSLPNLLAFLQNNSRMNVQPSEEVVQAGSPQIFQYPVVYMTGHGNVVFTDQEARNLRRYVETGGFWFIDDNYGLNEYITRELKKVFPNAELVELPYNHPIFQQQWAFPQGLPKIHEHDNESTKAFGLFFEGRLGVFLTYESDLGDGWEDPAVHNDPPELRQQALQMGANVLVYALTN